VSYFDDAFALVIGVEGGYVNNPEDPGGETKFGISKRRYPTIDIKNLTIDQAKVIYRRDYWDAHDLDPRPWREALLVFDCAVNGGNASRWLSMYSGNPQFVPLFQAEHFLYLASLPGWQDFGRGWARRIVTMALAANK
jgi:lysozyme family protein